MKSPCEAHNIKVLFSSGTILMSQREILRHNAQVVCYNKLCTVCEDIVLLASFRFTQQQRRMMKRFVSLKITGLLVSKVKYHYVQRCGHIHHCLLNVCGKKQISIEIHKIKNFLKKRFPHEFQLVAWICVNDQQKTACFESNFCGKHITTQLTMDLFCPPNYHLIQLNTK